ncbi:DUF167 domain-containing protein [Nanoarchaeota archaeon]
MRFKIKVIANSKQQKVEQLENQLKVHLTSPPIKGRANKELIDILSKHFKTKKTNIKINKGLTSNQKEIEIIS